MKQTQKNIIGIVGGMGPYAGLDLTKKIFDLTNANKDQDHIPVSMISIPEIIEDRTNFLLNPSLENPGIAIGQIVDKLVKTGATVIGMPCNTAHSPSILSEIKLRIPNNILFVNMIEAVVNWIQVNLSKIEKVGVLATSGTIQSKVYHNELLKKGLEPVTLPNEKQIMLIDDSIYNKSFGIKSFSNPITKDAKNRLWKGIRELIDLGSEAIILGCTEIPLAICEATYENTHLIDSTRILALELIKKSNPESLKM